MTREEIQSVIVGLEQAGDGEAVASRKLCHDALTLLREMTSRDVRTFWDAINRATDTFADLDRERKAVQS